MKQPAFQSFYQPEEAFVNGTTPESRESSKTGAVAAERVRSRNLEVIRSLWKEPRTLNEVAALTGMPLASICSLKAAIVEDLVWVDYQEHVLPDGRTTKRSRWRLR